MIRGGRVWTVFYALLAWIGARVRGFHAAVGLFLIIGIVLSLAMVVGFAALAREVMRGRTEPLDRAILLWVDAQAHPKLTVVAHEVTALGAGLTVWMIVGLASLFLWEHRRRYSVALLWVAAVGAGLVNWTLKSVFERPRPDVFEWRTPHAGHWSFPSGHSMTSMVVYLTLAFLIARSDLSPVLRRLTFAVAALVILLVGLSRVYLGVHYPTDVVAGYLAGFIWACSCALGIEAVRYFRHRRPEVSREEVGLDRGPPAPTEPA